VGSSTDSLDQQFAQLTTDITSVANDYMDASSYGEWANIADKLMAETIANMPELSLADNTSDEQNSTLAKLSSPLKGEAGAVTMDSMTESYRRIEGLDFLDTKFVGKMVGEAVKAMDMPVDDSALQFAKTSLDSLPYFLQSSAVVQSSIDSAAGLDIDGVRADFPVFKRKINGKQLVWLDNGATTQKPQSVIDRVSWFYAHENSNVHRGAHTLAAEATDAYELVRSKVAGLLGAPLDEEIIFVRGTTEGMNLIANVLGEKFLGPGDEILLSELEHHANIVPWQFVAKRTGAVIRVIPITDSGEIDLVAYSQMLGPATKIVSFTHVSNALGSVLPIHEMTRMAKSHDAIVIVDGAQGVPHRRVNVSEIGCDFYVFSGHKLFAPTGIGAVFGRKELWEQLAPWQGGGSMIKRVTFEHSTFSGLPNKFEAGTGSLASAVGLGAAIDYLNELGFERIERYETELVEYALSELERINSVRIIGKPQDRAGVISFVLEGIPTDEVGRLLDLEGIAVRAGHHCAQPALAHYGLETSVRPSFAFYNTQAEADLLTEALKRIIRQKR